MYAKGFLGGAVTTLVCILDVILFYAGNELYPSSQTSNLLIFMFTITGAVIVFMPLVSSQLTKWVDRGGMQFLDIPEVNTKVTFPVISSFLGEQAFGSLLATIMILVCKLSLTNFNVLVMTMVFLFLCGLSVLFLLMSIIRFSLYFRDSNNWLLSAVFALSVTFSFSLYYLGMYLGNQSI